MADNYKAVNTLYAQVDETISEGTVTSLTMHVTIQADALSRWLLMWSWFHHGYIDALWLTDEKGKRLVEFQYDTSKEASTTLDPFYEGMVSREGKRVVFHILPSLSRTIADLALSMIYTQETGDSRKSMRYLHGDGIFVFNKFDGITDYNAIYLTFYVDGM